MCLPLRRLLTNTVISSSQKHHVPLDVILNTAMKLVLHVPWITWNITVSCCRPSCLSSYTFFYNEAHRRSKPTWIALITQCFLADFTDVQSHVSKFNHGLITTWAMQVYALGSKTNGSPWPCGGEWVLEPIPARGVVIWSRANKETNNHWHSHSFRMTN